MRKNAMRFLVCAGLTYLAVAAQSIAQTACGISAPSSIGSNQSFTLCGPTGGGYTYEWYGPGLGSENEGRCVPAKVSNAGTYEFILILKLNDAEVDRCTKVVNVGGSTGGAGSCAITGPRSIESGASAQLCAANDGLHAYRWTGPNGFTATSACITVDEGGTYFLTSRNSFTGSTRQCTHHLSVTGLSNGSCDITGPTTITDGTTAQMCAPSRSNTSYRWTGPQGFAGSSRCLTAGAAGTYFVTIQNLTSGRSERCSHTITLADYDTGENQDPDEVAWDNCPRNLQFWRSAFGTGQSGGEANGITQAEFRTIARRVDEGSTYFNWSNDLEGMRLALNPGSSLTRRKQVTRQYAALLANVVTGELNLGFQGGENIGLDLDTRVDYAGATTVRELIVLTDRMLKANRGNYAKLNATLTAINRGRGIGPVCE
jgi:hypothetical protein